MLFFDSVTSTNRFSASENAAYNKQEEDQRSAKKAMQQLPGKRIGTQTFFHAGFSYHVDTRFPDKIVYRCASRSTTGCCGEVHDNDGVIVVGRDHIRHTANPHLYEEHLLRLEVLRQSRETLRSFDSIMRMVSLQFPAAAKNVTLLSMRRSMERERARARPAVPRNLREFDTILQDYPVTADIYRGMVTDANGSVAIVFAAEAMLLRLHAATEIFVDATFRVVPRKPASRQLLIVFVRKMDVAFPVAYIFCETKTTQMYVAIWEFLVNRAPGMRENLKTIVSDYERAIIASVGIVFPRAVSRGCWFHFCRAIYKKWLQLRLYRAPKELLWMAMSIALAPANRFDDCLSLLTERANALVGEYPAITRFAQYLRRQWRPLASVVAVGKCSLRTNNSCETFNRYIVGRLGGSHPNIWILLENLDDVLKYTEINWQQLETGRPITRGRTRAQAEEDERIGNLQDELLVGGLTIEQFLRGIMEYRRLNGVELYE